MNDLGFQRGKGRRFTHPDTRYSVEFQTGPVMVGEAPVTETARHQTDAGVVRLLSPTDSVKDRLAAFLHWSDRKGVELALEIIQRQPVNLANVERWVRGEPGAARERYDRIRNKLHAAAAEYKPAG